MAANIPERKTYPPNSRASSPLQGPRGLGAPFLNGRWPQAGIRQTDAQAFEIISASRASADPKIVPGIIFCRPSQRNLSELPRDPRKDTKGRMSLVPRRAPEMDIWVRICPQAPDRPLIGGQGGAAGDGEGPRSQGTGPNGGGSESGGNVRVPLEKNQKSLLREAV